MSYNGWSNYETWNVNLWLSNEEVSYRYWTEQAEEILSEAEPEYDWQTKEEAARYQLAEEMKESHEEYTQDVLQSAGAEASVISDLLGAALSDVNWDEIASHWIEDAKEAVER